MPYPLGHKERVRRSILRAARRMFNRTGYDGVSIDAVMAEAGLTRGAFYFYFDSKAHLYRESIGFILEEHPAQRWSEGFPSPIRAARLVEAYLSQRHLNDVEQSCPLVTHAAESARGDKELRAVFARVFRSLVETIRADCVEGDDGEEEALSIAALCVGGLSLARGLGDQELAERLLRASRAAVYKAAGWQDAERL
jgi:TetR/AcrR family transcriptional regulator, transcriptional repressor for nem operon